MSERQIAVGDLVVVVRACCNEADALGEVFVIAGIREKSTNCDHCNHTNLNELHGGKVSTFKAGVPLEWLKRIPPLSELESTEETIKETA